MKYRKYLISLFVLCVFTSLFIETGCKTSSSLKSQSKERTENTANGNARIYGNIDVPILDSVDSGTPFFVPKREGDVYLVHQDDEVNNIPRESDTAIIMYEPILVTANAEDSAFCKKVMPQKAFDGTPYFRGIVFIDPKARIEDASSGTIQSRVNEYYYQCLQSMNCETHNLYLKTICLIIDEKGLLRGLYFIPENNNTEMEQAISIEIFNRFRQEKFLPAVDIETNNYVPDIIEIGLP